jgi:hypothetical protein
MWGKVDEESFSLAGHWGYFLASHGIKSTGSLTKANLTTKQLDTYIQYL